MIHWGKPKIPLLIIMVFRMRMTILAYPQRLDKPTKFAWQTRLQHLWLAQVIRPALILWHICENLGQKSVGHQDFCKTLGVRTCQTWTQHNKSLEYLELYNCYRVCLKGTPKSSRILWLITCWSPYLAVFNGASPTRTAKPWLSLMRLRYSLT